MFVSLPSTPASFLPSLLPSYAGSSLLLLLLLLSVCVCLSVSQTISLDLSQLYFSPKSCLTSFHPSSSSSSLTFVSVSKTFVFSSPGFTSVCFSCFTPFPFFDASILRSLNRIFSFVSLIAFKVFGASGYVVCVCICLFFPFPLSSLPFPSLTPLFHAPPIPIPLFSFVSPPLSGSKCFCPNSRLNPIPAILLRESVGRQADYRQLATGRTHTRADEPQPRIKWI